MASGESTHALTFTIELAKMPKELTFDEQMIALRKKTRRSWKNLRKGCLELSGKDVDHPTFMVGACSRSFARRVAEETGADYRDILKWLDRNKLGV